MEMYANSSCLRVTLTVLIARHLTAAQLKAKKAEELKRLKALKRQEITEKLQKIQGERAYEERG
jgi:hypothetical protein